MADSRLDRRVQFDERSRAFPVRAAIPIRFQRRPRGYTWSVSPCLDQGSEGACVGFAWAHELAARPAVNSVDAIFAREQIYKAAQAIDEWPGESYEGTSVLAGAKVVKAAGYMTEYRWCFSLEDLILAVGYAGPVVLGLNWYSGMMYPASNGFIRPDGQVEGGHAICCFGVSPKQRFFRLHNSWGPGWGQNGNCLISFEALERLLHEAGEACVPIGRVRKKPTALTPIFGERGDQDGLE